MHATFRDGAFRLSPPSAGFREAIVSVVRPEFDTLVARFDLRQVTGGQDLAISPPLSAMDDRTLGLRVLLRGGSRQEETHFVPAAIDPAEFSGESIVCYLNRGGGGNPLIGGFAKSIGARCAYAEDGARDGGAAVWGIRRGGKEVMDAVQARRGHFYHFDHAYLCRGFRERFRITRNGFEAGRVRECPGDRIAGLDIALKPWGKGGRVVLVCPPTDAFSMAHRCEDWLETTLSKLREVTDRPIVVRTKPKPGDVAIPLEEALSEAHALVTHSSNIAVDAVIAGTPVFVAPTSAAAPVGLTDLAQIESPVRPEREAWLRHLSYSQFTAAEIMSGEAWRLLREFETRPFAAGAQGTAQ